MCVLQVFQEEMGVVKSHNLKPGGDKIPVTKQNRKGESTLRCTAMSELPAQRLHNKEPMVQTHTKVELTNKYKLLENLDTSHNKMPVT